MTQRRRPVGADDAGRDRYGPLTRRVENAYPVVENPGSMPRTNICSGRLGGDQDKGKDRQRMSTGDRIWPITAGHGPRQPTSARTSSEMSKLA